MTAHRLGHSGAMARHPIDGTAIERNAVVNGRSPMEIIPALAVPGDDTYHPCPEASPADDVPRSTVTKHAAWSGSEIFPGATRDVWISTPADWGDRPPALLVCQDGGGYLKATGDVRAVAVLDSLMHDGTLPPTVGVFVMPGRHEGDDDEAARVQRSVEYDTVDDAYVRFLDDELLPFVEAEIGRALSTEPADRIIAGISSGGIAAFNAAWHRPESFGRVLSHCGSFTNLRGGHEYPFLIRAAERRPIKVFLQTGTADANIPQGNWTLANDLVADALEYAGYDVRYEKGVGGHSLRHGGALFAESLRWLRDEHQPRTADGDHEIHAATRRRIAEIAPVLRRRGTT